MRQPRPFPAYFNRYRVPPPLAFVLLLALLLLPLAPTSAPAQGKARVHFGDHTWTVDVADTPTLQRKGLGGRAALAPDEGMLFLYPDKGRRTFWMRGMLIPIDIVWLDNRRVVHIEHRVQPPPTPDTPPPQLSTYEAPVPANMVLEIPAGQARELGLSVGDRLSFEFGG